jgi:hypothetical protein
MSLSLGRFRTTFTITADSGNQAFSPSADFGIQNLGWILNALGGKTFNHGLYRVLRSDQIQASTQAMEAAFPEYRGRIVTFAFDWLGRHFASDRGRVEKGHPQVLMLEVGAGEAMEIPASVVDFHNVELVDYTDDALAVPFWRGWRKENPTDLAFTDCVGYKVPLFLGGADVLHNLELIDLSVYVEVCGQLRNKVRTLRPGQSIRSVLFAD